MLLSLEALGRSVRNLLHSLALFLFPERTKRKAFGVAVAAARHLEITPQQFMEMAIISDRDGIEAGMQEFRRIKGWSAPA